MKLFLKSTKKYPYRKAISVNRTDVESPRYIDPDTDGETFAAAQGLETSLFPTDVLTSRETTRVIEGGTQTNILRGARGPTATSFEGKERNDEVCDGAGTE